VTFCWYDQASTFSFGQLLILSASILLNHFDFVSHYTTLQLLLYWPYDIYCNKNLKL
jgi:hypothetical protein